MAASKLSPILSSSSGNEEQPEEEEGHIESRLDELAGSSLAYDEGDDDDDSEDDEQSAFRHQEHQRRRATNASNLSYSSEGSSTRLSQQYLIHDSFIQKPTTQTVVQVNNKNNNKLDHDLYPNDYLNSCSSKINKKKLKQLIQSIPLPLAATCAITVFILFLILSECKSLQAAQGAVQSMVMDRAELESGQVGQVGQLSVGPSNELSQPRRRTTLKEQQENGAVRVENLEQPEARLLSQQLAFKREFINDLLQRRLSQSQQREAAQSSRPAQPAGPLETLGAMLFGSNSAAASQDTPNGRDETGQQEASSLGDAFIDGEPSRFRSQEVSSPRPANLRSSAIELDLSSEPQQHYNQPTQHLHHQNQNLNLNNQRQQGNKYHHQEQHHSHQAHKTNTEEHTKQHYQYLNNDHDRPFDVVQVRKYIQIHFSSVFHAKLWTCWFALLSVSTIDHASLGAI